MLREIEALKFPSGERLVILVIQAQSRNCYEIQPHEYLT